MKAPTERSAPHWLERLPAAFVGALPVRPEALAAGAGGRLRRVDLQGCAGKTESLDAIAAALEFPGHFGRNLDALYDCLLDLPPGLSGDLVIWLDGLDAGSAVGHQLLAVFRDAATQFAAQGRRLRVFH